jgi:hypothetical protein
MLFLALPCSYHKAELICIASFRFSRSQEFHSCAINTVLRNFLCGSLLHRGCLQGDICSTRWTWLSHTLWVNSFDVCLFIYEFIYLCLAVLGFELRALGLLYRPLSFSSVQCLSLFCHPWASLSHIFLLLMSFSLSVCSSQRYLSTACQGNQVLYFHRDFLCVYSGTGVWNLLWKAGALILEARLYSFCSSYLFT